MSSDYTMRLVDDQRRPVLFVALTGTDLADGEADAVADAIRAIADDRDLEVVER